MSRYFARVQVEVELEADNLRRATAGAAACIDERGMQYEYGVKEATISGLEIRIGTITTSLGTFNATLRPSESVEPFGTPSEAETPNAEGDTNI